MKNMVMMVALLGGATLAGYMYLKKNPEKLEMIGCAMKDVSHSLSNKLEEE